VQVDLSGFSPLTYDSESSTCSGAVTDLSTGLHTFVVEFDDDSTLLAEGGALQYIYAGANSVGIIANGVAATAQAYYNSVSGAATFMIGDADYDVITSAPSAEAFFDNGPLLLVNDTATCLDVTSPCSGTVALSTPNSFGNATALPATLSLPDQYGDDYSATLTCLTSGFLALDMWTSASPANTYPQSLGLSEDLGINYYPTNSALSGSDNALILSCSGLGATPTISSTVTVNVQSSKRRAK
jgi:hypothetical protein